MALSNCNLDSLLIASTSSLVASTASCYSRREVVNFFNGTTLDFPTTNCTPNAPLFSFHLTYTHAPNASSQASEKTQSVGNPLASDGVKHIFQSSLHSSIRFAQITVSSLGKSHQVILDPSLILSVITVANQFQLLSGRLQ